MSQVTELASGQLTATETITVELIEADQTAAVIIVRWPSKCVPSATLSCCADGAARTFAAAAVRLAAIKRDRKLSGAGWTLPQPGRRGPMIRQSFHDLALGLCLVLLAFWYISGFLRLGRQAMTESAPEPVPPKPQVDKKGRWPHIVGIVAIGLIALGAIVVAIPGVEACSTNSAEVGECRRAHVQHLLAVLGTVTAALASFRQGKTAKRKSDHHGTEWRTETDEKLKSAHAYDFHHFKTVRFWWYIFFGGALAAVLAEFIDWWGQPVIDWLTQQMK